MRRSLPLLLAVCLAVSASAQLSLGAGGNYTRFLGDYQTNKPGFHTRVQYEKGLYGLGLQYTYHAPLHLLFVGSLDAPSSSPNSTDTKIDIRFQSIDLFLRRAILDNTDSKAKLYGGLGASWVFLRYQEKYMTAYTGAPVSPLEDGKNQSLSVNAMLGTEYSLGRVALYGEAAYSLPTSKWYIKQTINTISPRLSLQVGVKLPLN